MEEVSQVIEDSIDAFGDDLFRYLLPRRIPVFNLMPATPRSPDITSAFSPEIGMAVLCESYRRQEDFIVYFEEYYPHFVHDNRSYMTFCATYALKLITEHEGNVLQMAITVASMILELGVFCHVRDHPRFKYYGGVCWSDIFKFYLSFHFFNRYSWDAFRELARDDARFYNESNFEILLDQNRVEYKIDWLRMFDYGTALYYPGMENDPIRIRTPSPTEEAEAAALLQYSEGSTNEAEVPAPPEVAETSEQRVILPTDDDPIPTPKRPESETEKSTAIPVQKKRQPIAELKRLIYEGDSPCKLLEILENRKKVELLMKSDVFMKVVHDSVENPDERMENKHLMEFVKLILMGNEDLARYFVRATNYLTVTNQMKSTMAETPGSADDASGSGSAAVAQPGGTSKPDASSQSGKHLGAIPKRRKRSATGRIRRINESDERLLNDFKRIVSAGGDPAGLEICENFKFPFNEKVLLKSSVFKSIMELTVRFPVRRWSNDWILSFVKVLIGASVTPSSSPSKVKSTDRPLQMPGVVTTSTSAEDRKESEIKSEQAGDIPPGDASHDSAGADSNVPVVLDSDEDSDDETKLKNTVYVDIVNLSTTFKQLLVDVVKEGSAPQGAEGQQDQAKASSRRKRRNRKRSKRSRPQMASQPENVGKDYEPPLQPSAKAISEGYSSHAAYSEGDLFRTIQGIASFVGTGENLEHIIEEARNPVPGRDVEGLADNPDTPAEPKQLGTGSQGIVTAPDSSTTPTVTVAPALETEVDVPEEEEAAGDEVDLQELFDMIPSSNSDEILEWIFRQILARKPNFFEVLQNKNIDETTKKELLKYKEKFPGPEK